MFQSKNIRTAIAALFVTLGGFAVTGCDEGPMEEAGDAVDEAGDEIEDAFD